MSNTILLNVGGAKFETTRETLTKTFNGKSSPILERIMSGEFLDRQPYFLDLDPVAFGQYLDCLRHDNFPVKLRGPMKIIFRYLYGEPQPSEWGKLAEDQARLLYSKFTKEQESEFCVPDFLSAADRFPIYMNNYSEDDDQLGAREENFLYVLHKPFLQETNYKSEEDLGEEFSERCTAVLKTVQHLTEQSFFLHVCKRLQKILGKNYVVKFRKEDRKGDSMPFYVEIDGVVKPYHVHCESSHVIKISFKCEM